MHPSEAVQNNPQKQNVADSRASSRLRVAHLLQPSLKHLLHLVCRMQKTSEIISLAAFSSRSLSADRLLGSTLLHLSSVAALALCDDRITVDTLSQKHIPVRSHHYKSKWQANTARWSGEAALHSC